MRAVVVRSYGSYDDARVEEIDVPQPGKGEALWRSLAATTGDIVVFIEASSDLLKWIEIASSRFGSPFKGDGNVEEKEDRGGLFNCMIADVADAEAEPFRFLRVRVESGRSE